MTVSTRAGQFFIVIAWMGQSSSRVVFTGMGRYPEGLDCPEDNKIYN